MLLIADCIRTPEKQTKLTECNFFPAELMPASTSWPESAQRCYTKLTRAQLFDWTSAGKHIPISARIRTPESKHVLDDSYPTFLPHKTDAGKYIPIIASVIEASQSQNMLVYEARHVPLSF
jgi:hypothetical protein